MTGSARRSKSLAICVSIIGLAATYAVIRHDLLFATMMLLVATVFAKRVGKQWQVENDGRYGLDFIQLPD